jgi:hypothetical protein
MTRPLIVLTTLLVLAGLAFAQGPWRAQAHRFGPGAAATEWSMTMPFGRHHLQAGGPSELAGAMQEALSTALGLPHDEIEARRQAGESLADIAASAGVSIEALQEAWRDARDAAIAELRAAGTITELQAQRMQERGDEAFAANLEREGCGGLGAGGGPQHQFRPDDWGSVPPMTRMMANRAPGGRMHGPQGRW